MMQTRTRIFSIISYGSLSHASLALVGLIRVPLLIHHIGFTNFGQFAAASSIWVFFQATGEGVRASTRQSALRGNAPTLCAWRTYASGLRALFAVSLSVAAIFGLLWVFFAYQVNLTYFMILIAVAVANLPFAILIGRTEAAGHFTLVSKAAAAGQVASLLLLVALINWVDIRVTFVVYMCAPLLSGGIVLMAQRRHGVGVSNQEIVPDVELESRGASRRFQVLHIAETAVYAFDTLIVAAFMGDSAAANYAVLQRLFVAFTVVPTALNPLVSTLWLSTQGAEEFRRIRKIVYLSSGCIGILFIVGLPAAFQVLSAGKGDVPFLALASCVVLQTATTCSTPWIFSCVTGRLLQMRTILSVIAAVSSPTLKGLGVSALGLPGLFLAGAAVIISSALVLRRLRV